MLLAAGADPTLRTRIDECETLREMAEAAGMTAAVALLAGLFYGVEGIRVGVMRHLEIAPHLAYGDRGVPDVIPANALLIAEIAILGICRRIGDHLPEIFIASRQR